MCITQALAISVRSVIDHQLGFFSSSTLLLDKVIVTLMDLAVTVSASSSYSRVFNLSEKPRAAWFGYLHSLGLHPAAEEDAVKCNEDIVHDLARRLKS